MAIITRHGNEADFDPNRMRTAEFASFDDSGKIMHTQRPGVVRQLMTVQDAEAMIDEKIEPAVTRAEAAAESAEASAELANSSEVSAGASAEEAETNAGLSQSYAVGTGGVVREGDDTDNAKYYYEQARAIVDVEIATTEKAGIVKPDGVTISVEADGTIHSVVEGGVTGVKGASETEYRSGNVNITAENVGAYTTNAVDLSKAELQVLGWNVPNEMPIKNTLVNGVLTQNVGRVDLSSLSWTYDSSFSAWESDSLWGKAKGTVDNDAVAKIFSVYYIASTNTAVITTSTVNVIAITQTGSIATQQRVWCRNGSPASVPIGYLYYELSTPITHTVPETEGVGAFAKRNVRTNLLKPTLASTTLNGVTCTNNGDGTYTLNGTASATAQFNIVTFTLPQGTHYKFLCNADSNMIGTVFNTAAGSRYEQGNGINFVAGSGAMTISVSVLGGHTVSNKIVRPMITTDLTATYDDFIPYTGDTGTLNGDVAELQKVNKLTVDVTLYGINFKRRGKVVDVYADLSNLEESAGITVGTVNTDLIPANKYCVIPVFSTSPTSSYSTIGSLWINERGQVYLYKPAAIKNCFVSGTYVVNN